MEEYEGIISKVIFYNPENKYIVAVFETDDEEITITGNMSMSIMMIVIVLKETM